MTVTRVSRTKLSSDCAVGTLEFEFMEDIVGTVGFLIGCIKFVFVTAFSN